MSSLTPKSLALRLAVCIAVSALLGMLWNAASGMPAIGYVFAAVVWAVAFVRPLLEIVPAFERMVHRHALSEWEGKYHIYGRTHLRAYFDGDEVWFDARDVLSVLDKKPASWLETRFTPGEYGVLPGRKEKGFTPAGVMKLTEISNHPEAGKFRLWFERSVVFTLSRKREIQAEKSGGAH